MLKRMLCAGLLFSGPLGALELQASLDWPQAVELGLMPSGVVSQVYVAPGQRVDAGQLLLELDQREHDARLTWAQAQVNEAKIRNAEAQKELERAQDLFERTLTSDHELQLARISSASAVTALMHAENQLTQAQLNREYSRLMAPFTGLIVSVKAYPGQVLNNRLQTQHLMSLVNDAQLVASAHIDPELSGRIKLGQKVKVDVGGELKSGVVSGVSQGSLAGGEPNHVLQILLDPVSGQQLKRGEQVKVQLDYE